MKIEFIERIRNLLEKRWRYVYYSDDQKAYTPELCFFEIADYEILAREIWLYLSKRPHKRDFIKRTAEYLVAQAKYYSSSYLHTKFRCKRVANLLHKLYCARSIEDDSYFQASYIKDVRLELTQKYRTHCCSDLGETDNAERNYFCRSMVVYVREINTYVLTNWRKYIYHPEKDEYILDQTIWYEVLDFCPFCGKSLKELRIQKDDADELIKQTICNWRDSSIGLLSNGEEVIYKITRNGVNIYDSYPFIAEILSEKYANFDNGYGVDTNGVIGKNKTFITAEKLMILHDSYNPVPFYSTDLENVEDKDLTTYFREKFKNKSTFSEDEKISLRGLLHNALWTIYHHPQCVEELEEGD